MWKFFSKEIVRPFMVPDYIIFNVDNFNKWFNYVGNGATYAHSGIFLRVDKLSNSHVEEYLKMCYGITSTSEDKIVNFTNSIRDNWLKQINKTSE